MIIGNMAITNSTYFCHLYIRRIVMTDLEKFFAIGQKIQIAHIDMKGHLQEYTSQVVDLKDEDFVEVLIPMHKSRAVYLREDSLVKILAARGDAVYEFKAVVYERLFGRVPLLRLKIISDVNKIQRRDFYRLKMMRDVEVRFIDNLQEKEFSEKFKCNLHDLSAGGILISTKKEFQEGDMLELTLDLNGTEIIAYGIIVRRIFNAGHKAPYSYGVKFDKMSEFDKNRVTKFIFEEQRKLIKKGLI